MRRICIIVPGIHTSKRESREWCGRLAGIIEAGVPESTCIVYHHGWIAGVQILARYFRRRKVKRFQNWVAARLREIDPGAVPCAVAHSFGTWLVHQSMTDNGGPHTFWDRLVYCGGIVSCREDFKQEAGHFWELLNFFSRHDEVVRFAPFGHCGFAGFQAAHPDGPVRNVETRLEHTGYLQAGPVWARIVSFLGGTA